MRYSPTTGRRRRVLALPTLMLFGAIGCANCNDSRDGAASGATSGVEVSEVTVQPKEVGTDAVPPQDVGMQRLVAMAQRDLAAKLGIDSATIEVVTATYVTWRDSGMGCSQPDMQFAQVLTNGARIVLRVGDNTYHYHSGRDQAPFLCKNPSTVAPLPSDFAER